MTLKIEHTPINWHGPPDLSWAGAAAGMTSDVSFKSDGSTVWRDEACQVLELLEYLESWTRAGREVDLAYDEGIEGPLDEPLMIRPHGRGLWIVGSSGGSGRRTVVPADDLDAAIKSFERAVAAEFRVLTGLEYHLWLVDR